MGKRFGEKVNDSYNVARGATTHMSDEMLQRAAADPNNGAHQQKAVADEIAARQDN